MARRVRGSTAGGVAKRKRASKPKLLSGGSPQIAKADGDAPVQAYIAALPGWKRDVGRRLDALVVRSVPNVRKAVQWIKQAAADGCWNGAHERTAFVV